MAPRPICDAALRILFSNTTDTCKLAAYRDAGGVWTIGWGHTGPEVHEGLTWTQEFADEMRQHDLAAFSRYVTFYAKGLTLNDHQFGALVSLAYNAGLVALEEVCADLRRGNKEAFDLWQSFNHDQHGVKLAGLVARRQKEIALFEQPE